MPELTYGNVVNYKDITEMEGYYENSKEKQDSSFYDKEVAAAGKEED
jgi:hypothetical protein